MSCSSSETLQIVVITAVLCFGSFITILFVLERLCLSRLFIIRRRSQLAEQSHAEHIQEHVDTKENIWSRSPEISGHFPPRPLSTNNTHLAPDFFPKNDGLASVVPSIETACTQGSVHAQAQEAQLQTTSNNTNKKSDHTQRAAQTLSKEQKQVPERLVPPSYLDRSPASVGTIDTRITHSTLTPDAAFHAKQSAFLKSKIPLRMQASNGGTVYSPDYEVSEAPGGAAGAVGAVGGAADPVDPGTDLSLNLIQVTQPSAGSMDQQGEEMTVMIDDYMFSPPTKQIIQVTPMADEIDDRRISQIIQETGVHAALPNLQMSSVASLPDLPSDAKDKWSKMVNKANSRDTVGTAGTAETTYALQNRESPLKLFSVKSVDEQGQAKRPTRSSIRRDSLSLSLFPSRSASGLKPEPTGLDRPRGFEDTSFHRDPSLNPMKVEVSISQYLSPSYKGRKTGFKEQATKLMNNDSLSQSWEM